jgi:AraC-like DNA-binding protein
VDQPLHVVYTSALVSISDIRSNESLVDVVPYALTGGTLVFIRSGLFVRRKGAESVTLDANYVLFGREGDYLCVDGAAKEPCSCTVFRFSDRSFFNGSASQGPYALSAPATYLKQTRLLNDVWLGRSDSIDEAAIAIVSETIGSIANACGSAGRHSETIRAIRQLVYESLSQRVSLAEVGRRLYLSPFTVSRLFHRETGISLRRYAQRLRLRKALNLMLQGAGGLTDIAIELGFYDEPHFSKAFHAEFGIPPALTLATVCDRMRP